MFSPLTADDMAAPVSRCLLGDHVCQQGDWKYDVYAAYCFKDREEVNGVLEFLRERGLSVYDPHFDAILGQRLLDAWLDNGIYTSHVTVVFLTKNFLHNANCIYQADNAIVRNSKTKGKHMIVPVMLSSCKVPKNLRRFNSIFAWRYREDPVFQQKKIFRAIKGSHSCSAHSIYRKTIEKGTRTGSSNVQLKYNKSSIATTSPMSTLQLVRNVNKLRDILKQCVLKCNNDGCLFQREGIHYLEFSEHIRECKHKFVTCTHDDCQQKVKRRNSNRHRDRCKYKTSVCPYEKCSRKFTVIDMRLHVNVCPFRTINCPNAHYGCRFVFNRKDIDTHLRHCEYVKQPCKACSVEFFKADIETHSCSHANQMCKFCHRDCLRKDLPMHEIICEKGFLCKNAGCKINVPRGLMNKHALECEFSTYPCGNEDCMFKDNRSALDEHSKTCEFKREPCPSCGIKLAVKYMDWHMLECDRCIQCELCNMFISSSSKQSHDKWSCTARRFMSYCDTCKTWFTSDAFDADNHVETCQRNAPPEYLDDDTEESEPSELELTHVPATNISDDQANEEFDEEENELDKAEVENQPGVPKNDIDKTPEQDCHYRIGKSTPNHLSNLIEITKDPTHYSFRGRNLVLQGDPWKVDVSISKNTWKHYREITKCIEENEDTFRGFYSLSDYS